MQTTKTNAMRILDSESLEYEVHFYESGDSVDGISVAHKLGQDVNRVFKTLVTKGKSTYFVFVIPVAEELDLKKAAKSVSEKSVEMIHVKDINKVTGYIRGGCSPVGMKKIFKTVINSTALDFDKIIFSGGKIGAQIEMSPKELATLIGADFDTITA